MAEQKNGRRDRKRGDDETGPKAGHDAANAFGKIIEETARAGVTGSDEVAAEAEKTEDGEFADDGLTFGPREEGFRWIAAEKKRMRVNHGDREEATERIEGVGGVGERACGGRHDQRSGASPERTKQQSSSIKEKSRLSCEMGKRPLSRKCAAARNWMIS